MKHYLIRIFFLLVITQFISEKNVVAQQTKIAPEISFNTIQKMKDDTVKIKALFDLGIPLEETDTILCNKVYDEAIAISRRLSNGKFECKALINKGILKRTHGKYDEAKIYYEQAYQAALKSNFQAGAAKALINIGNIYINEYDFEEAAKFYIEGVKYLEETNDYIAMSPTYGNIANAFRNQTLYDKALEYSKKAVDAALLSKDERTIGVAYMYLSVIYNNMLDSAKNLEAGLKALYYLRHTVQRTPMQSVYQNIASYYIGTKNFLKADLYCDSALLVAKELNNDELIGMSLILKGMIARENKNITAASDFMIEAKKITDSNGSPALLENWHKEMFFLDSLKGNFKDALSHYKEQSKLAHKRSNATLMNNTLALERKYQTEKKQALITQLESEKKIQGLTLKQRIIWIYFLIGGLILISLTGFLFYKNTNRKQLLTEQNAAIQQNKIKELEQQKQLVAANSILQGQETERNRIAKDLHDGLGGILSGIKLNLSSMKGNVVIHENDALLFSKSINQLDNAINEMRRLAHNMVPEALLRFGLAEAIQDYCDSINESNMVKMRFTQLGFQQSLDQSTQVILYRIVQELSNNAIKHAEAKNIFIQLSHHEKGITLTVEDDGKGFDTGNLQQIKGTGLQNVQSRVDYLKGILEIQSSPSQGTSVNIEIGLS